MNSSAQPTLHYDLHGTHGPYLLLVHGMLSSRSQWLPNLESLSEFCRPVVVELFGHGRSPSPADGWHYTPASYLRQFESIREGLGVERWLIGGQSLGASLTIRYALEYPQRVIAQLATNSRSAFSDEEWYEPMSEQARRLQEQGRGYIEKHPLNPTRGKRLPEEVQTGFAKDSHLVTVTGLANTGLYTVCNAPLRKHLPESRIPCLLINGQWEKKFQPHRDHASKHMQNLRVVDLPGGHAVNLDAALEFNRAVKEFFQSRLAEEPVHGQ